MGLGEWPVERVRRTTWKEVLEQRNNTQTSYRPIFLFGLTFPHSLLLSSPGSAHKPASNEEEGSKSP